MRIEPQGGENRRFEIERQVVVAGTANDEKWGETEKVAPPFLRFHTPKRKRLYLPMMSDAMRDAPKILLK